MAEFKVYISSTYRDLQKYRAAIINFFDPLRDEFEVKAMEHYTADSSPPLDECIQHVEECDFYILILANRYGFIPKSTNKVANPENISITHLEYRTSSLSANNKKVFAFFAEPNKDDFETDDDKDKTLCDYKKGQLKKFKEEVQDKHRVDEGFTDANDLAIRVAKAMWKAVDKYADLLKKNVKQLEEQIHAPKPDYIICKCNRYEPSDKFHYEFFTLKNPVHFFLIHSHENDLPHRFVEKTKLELEKLRKGCIPIELKPSLIRETSDYERMQFNLQKAILSALPPGNGFSDPASITIETLFNWLEKQKDVSCLIISWYIQSIFWKKNLFQKHLNTFSKIYQSLNKGIKTEKNIIFFGILRYNEIFENEISEKEFNRRVNTFRFGKMLPQLTKIARKDISDWIEDNGIADNPEEKKNLINETFGTPTKKDFYFSEIESGLKAIIHKANNNK